MTTINRNDLYLKIDLLIEKYKDNEYVLSKLKNYINNFLPFTLESYNKTQIEREERKNKLTTETSEFTERFLLKNRCSYCLHNELFILYDGFHFKGYSEDDIQHQILTKITNEKKLIPWKFKIKNTIIKKIKDISPLLTIPESATIQFVINSLCPSIFPSRNYAKYFLTLIGDCLLYKNTNKLIYITSSNLKELVRELGNLIYLYFGLSNVFSCIKFKYHGHDYKSCRLLQLENNKLYNIPLSLSKHILDFLCVATHYSVRYESADKFLEQCTESTLKKQSMYLSNNSPSDIVNSFIDNTLSKVHSSKIKYKQIIFLWKKYLEKINIPNIIFYDSLKSILISKLNYDETTDSFIDITSNHLPLVTTFLDFWETTITEGFDIESELEVEELNKLFKSYHGKSWSISDNLLIELIKHFYSDVIIDSNKFILNIKCNLWNKIHDITQSLESFKIYCINKGNKSLESINSAYEYYSKYKKNKWITNKNYFEKIVKKILKNNVDEHGIISCDWVN